MNRPGHITGLEKPFSDREAGMALLVVLWTVALLVLLVMSLSNSLQVEVRTATYRKEAAQSYAYACGGVETAIYEIAYPSAGDQKPSVVWTWRKGARDGVVQFPRGRAMLQIVGENGKINLNSASEDQLARLFELHGMAGSQAAGLAKQIVDWRRPPENDVQQVSESVAKGAPRHAPFQSSEELLRVAGMSRGLFYGTAEVDEQEGLRAMPGVGRTLTVRSGVAQLNINYASETALRCVPGIDADLALAIVQERRKAPFKTVAEVGDRISLLLPDEALPYLTTTEPDTYTIISAGEIEGSPVRRTVAAVIQLAPEGGLRYRVLNWYADNWSE
jgi:type II secretory pathway component PulK